jgi:SH3-like domain-containing protein
MTAAIGFKLHTGWASVVAVTLGKRTTVLARRRAALLPPDDAIPRFVYHAAAELELRQAGLLAELASHAAVSVGCGVITTGAPGASVPDLAAILQAHPLIHAAEGRLFQSAVLAACARHDIAVLTMRERDVWAAASDASGEDVATLRERVDALRASVGAPWGADQKSATAAAIAAGYRAGR